MSTIVRLLGSVMVLSGCTAMGCIQAGKLRRRHQLAVLLGRYWGDYLRRMELTAQPPAMIAAALAEYSMYREVAFAQALAKATEGDFGVTLMKAMRELELPEPLQKTMLPLAESLGLTPMETERQVLLGVLAALRQEEKYWAEQENHQGVLFRRLGVLGGLALVILLI